MVPDRATQMRIRADATRVARETCHLQGAEREHSLREEQRFRSLSVSSPVEAPEPGWMDGVGEDEE